MCFENRALAAAGGNVDDRRMGVGATMYYPVEVKRFTIICKKPGNLCSRSSMYPSCVQGMSCIMGMTTGLTSCRSREDYSLWEMCTAPWGMENRAVPALRPPLMPNSGTLFVLILFCSACHWPFDSVNPSKPTVSALHFQTAKFTMATWM